MSQITVNAYTFNKLKLVKIKLSRNIDDYDHMEPGEKGSEISWNAVLNYLMGECTKVQALESRIISLGKQIENHVELRGDEMKELLEKSLVKQPIYIQAGAMANSTVSLPPPPPRLSPKHIIPISQNIKDDLKVELNSLFDGGIPKPSRIKEAVEASEEKEHE